MSKETMSSEGTGHHPRARTGWPGKTKMRNRKQVKVTCGWCCWLCSGHLSSGSRQVKCKVRPNSNILKPTCWLDQNADKKKRKGRLTVQRHCPRSDLDNESHCIVMKSFVFVQSVTRRHRGVVNCTTTR